MAEQVKRGMFKTR